jgi:hypothetical protein
MIRVPSRIRIGRLAVALVLFLVLVGCVESMLAGEPDGSANTSNAAKNLARIICGTQIECITPDGAVLRASGASSQDPAGAALIREDQTIGRALPRGETIVILTLPRISLLDRFNFLNENATTRGDVTLSVSNYWLPARSSQWNEVGSAVSFSEKRIVNISIPGIEAKYVRLSFRVQKEGRITALGLYGNETLKSFALRQAKISSATQDIQRAGLNDSNSINFNFANLYARARVVYVSSGSLSSAARMIDDDASTCFRFSPTDPHPTAIVELAGSPQLHRAGAIYKMQSGRLDIYLTNQFPSNPDKLDRLKPIASVTDVAGSGRAAVNFDIQKARYLALRWTPDPRVVRPNGFEVAEIGGFGVVPLSGLQVSEAPIFYVENTQMVANEPVDPPVLPAVPPVSP